jgi:hypothetical protein
VHISHVDLHGLQALDYNTSQMRNDLVINIVGQMV